MTNKNYRIEYKRTFLLENLPPNFSRAAEHWQFFDNYIDDTRLCLRTLRNPKSKEWIWILEQRDEMAKGDYSGWQVSEIFLNQAEHAVFEQFEGREVSKNERIETNELRFNRYRSQLDGQDFEIDIYLNPLWGLILATIYFESAETQKKFSEPAFAIAEVTQNSFFVGKNLVGKTFADVQNEFSNIVSAQT